MQLGVQKRRLELKGSYYKMAHLCGKKHNNELKSSIVIFFSLHSLLIARCTQTVFDVLKKDHFYSFLIFLLIIWRLNDSVDRLFSFQVISTQLGLSLLLDLEGFAVQN